MSEPLNNGTEDCCEGCGDWVPEGDLKVTNDDVWLCHECMAACYEDD